MFDGAENANARRRGCSEWASINRGSQSGGRQCVRAAADDGMVTGTEPFS